MSPLRAQLVALAVASATLFPAVPAFAQRDGRRNGDRGARSAGVERAQPRARGNAGREAAASQGRVEARRYNSRPYYYRPYAFRPYVNRYVVPYGYRPYGYGPGWSLNLYFGRPSFPYGYPSYGYPRYGYSPAPYGYYGIVPGRAYGALRIVEAPPEAQVLVDGYYAGVVDDYDGVFQHLNLEPGPHRIEIEAPGYPPVSFDVRIEPGRTINYRANMP
jgi:hypothetical protein